MRNIKIMSEVEVNIGACELAQVFWAMDSEEQCAFFDELYDIAGGNLGMQMEHVISDPKFSIKAKMAMDCIGDYAKESRPKIKAYGDEA